jgi:hypothetical protein
MYRNDAERQETRQRVEYREAHDLKRKDVAPHVFNTAERVYANATSKGGKKQAIIISGESGSGKTFTTKMMLRCVDAPLHVHVAGLVVYVAPERAHVACAYVWLLLRDGRRTAYGLHAMWCARTGTSWSGRVTAVTMTLRRRSLT